jgi:hypothetical protein
MCTVQYTLWPNFKHVIGIGINSWDKEPSLEGSRPLATKYQSLKPELVFHQPDVSLIPAFLKE